MKTVDERFEKRMRQAAREVAREFESLDPELVEREFARVTEALLENATVTDFVPVLVHRQVRQNLRAAPAAASATAGT